MGYATLGREDKNAAFCKQIEGTPLFVRTYLEDSSETVEDVMKKSSYKVEKLADKLPSFLKFDTDENILLVSSTLPVANKDLSLGAKIKAATSMNSMYMIPYGKSLIFVPTSTGVDYVEKLAEDLCKESGIEYAGLFEYDTENARISPCRLENTMEERDR